MAVFVDKVLESLSEQSGALRAQAAHTAQIGAQQYFGPIFEDIAAAPYLVVTAHGRTAPLAEKISASLASTGTPSYFEPLLGGGGTSLQHIDPPDRVLAVVTGSDASQNLLHLDRTVPPSTSIDVIAPKAVTEAVSWSRNGSMLPLVGEPESSDDSALDLLALAMGDALLSGLESFMGFTASDFVKDHPKGALGSSIAKQQKAGDAEQISYLAPAEQALDCLVREGDGIDALIEATVKDRVTLEKMLTALSTARHRIVTTGMGKPGYCCRYMAAMLNEKGIPAFALDPAEGVHGDLGRIVDGTVTLAYSHSGETAEMMGIVPRALERGTTLLALTNNPDSSLGREAEVVMFSGASEVDPIEKAPTGSPTATVALMNSIVKRLTS